MASTTLTMIDGVHVVVPDSLNLLTPYVLLEQQDWFEDEIKFLRRLLAPGDAVIDIGANYGAYTLSMARTVGPTGGVWAFEPASATARMLAAGIAANGFAHVVLEQSALSSAGGTARLSLNPNAELNALLRDPQAAGAAESVTLVTLDDCMQRYGWRDIALLKIDAEGEEANILRGGTRFLAECSPLVQYEIKAGAGPQMELVRHFAAMGYASYRLVPGLDLLVPFDAGAAPDGFLLNLFCCKPDRAERLAARGFLLAPAASDALPEAARRKLILTRLRSRGGFGWRETVAKLPYGIALADTWSRKVAEGRSAAVEDALALHALSRDPSAAPAERFAALEAALGTLGELCAREPLYLRRASLARVAREYGARSLATSALGQLADAILRQRQLDPGEPFLAPGERFDAVAPRESIGNWVLAAVLEEYERLGAYSSFYTGMSALQRLQTIRDLGFGGEEMQRRLELLQKRFYLVSS